MSNDQTPLQQILNQLANGLTSVDQVTEKVRGMLHQAANQSAKAPTEDSVTPSPAPSQADLNIDLDRQRRCGFPEVVYGPGKTPQAVVAAFQELSDANQNCFATRCNEEQIDAVRSAFPNVIINEAAKTLRLMLDEPETNGRVPVVTAGTSDLPVAEEAVETLRWMGVETELIIDVGVAGPQRFLNEKHKLDEANAVIVVAGMEGALPSVVGGWVNCPVIAVPTSVGYGAAFGGVAALLGMLNSCASNVAVVNIDAGFKAGYVAGLMVKKVE